MGQYKSSSKKRTFLSRVELELHLTWFEKDDWKYVIKEFKEIKL